MARRVNFYATGEFDRAAARREDVAWLRAKLADPASRLYPVWRTRNFVSDPAAPRALTWTPPPMRGFETRPRPWCCSAVTARSRIS
jgi:NAD+ diphosphatase